MKEHLQRGCRPQYPPALDVRVQNDERHKVQEHHDAAAPVTPHTRAAASLRLVRSNATPPPLTRSG
eukprot:4452482-Pyramimonas_sp.AAC.2